jgi:hypothetical protein
LRRLLVFGTGAAVIGILLTVVAFYEAYLIVGSLQKELASSINNQTLLLEDATLEAVFLGVMVALGYGLISKGLDGIRKQELLELEIPAEEMLALEGKVSSTPREAFRAIPRKAAPTERVVKSAYVSSTSTTTVQDRPATLSASETASPPVADQQKSTWQPPIWHQPVEPEALSETPEPQMIDAPQYSPESGKQPMSGEVAWEGGSLPPQGTEVAPQLTAGGTQIPSADAPVASSMPSDSIVQAGQADAVAPPKRKRGRPKGSKKSTKETAEETV